MKVSVLIGEAVANCFLIIGSSENAVFAAQLAEDFGPHFSATAETDALAIMLTTDRASVGLFLAAVLAGVRVLSIPPPGRGDDISLYINSIREMVNSNSARRVVARDDIAAMLAAADIPAIGHADLTGNVLAGPSHGGFSLTQYSSGTTGTPRPILMDDLALGTNITAIIAATSPEAGDVAVSWLPLSHDMGLVGLLLTGIAAAHSSFAGHTTVVLLSPEMFLRRPGAWLSAMSTYRATFTAAPDFAYRLATRSTSSQPIDLSRLRVAIVGGEVVRQSTLQEFELSFTSLGLSANALCPAYGMAEIGLCGALTPPTLRWRETIIPASGRNPTAIVSSGAPLPGIQIRESHATEGAFPALEISTPTLGADGRTGTSLPTVDGWYRPGDVGFLDDNGWVYVCGRADDTVVVRGRNVNVLPIEAAVGGLDGIRPGRVVAVSLPTGEWAIIAEVSRKSLLDKANELRRQIARTSITAAGITPDDIVLTTRGSLPITTSGKLRRSRTAELHLQHAFTQP